MSWWRYYTTAGRLGSGGSYYKLVNGAWLRWWCWYGVTEVEAVTGGVFIVGWRGGWRQADDVEAGCVCGNLLRQSLER